jgi:hypothetical protein
MYSKSAARVKKTLKKKDPEPTLIRKSPQRPKHQKRSLQMDQEQKLLLPLLAELLLARLLQG